MWGQAITAFGGSTVLIAVVAWLTRSIIVHFLDKDVATFKIQLEKQVLEHEIRFRRVDEKVAHHLAEVYARLFNLFRSMRSYVSIVEFGGEPSKEEKLAIVKKASDEFWDYFLPNRLYIPPTLYTRTRDVASEMAEITNKFTQGLQREKRGLVAEGIDHWVEAFNAAKENADPLFTDLVAAFQQRLGVEDIPVSQIVKPSAGSDKPVSQDRL